MTRGSIAHTRAAFNAEVRAAACSMDREQRAGLVRMLRSLRVSALAFAEESGRRRKWMMLAYWRVVAVYAGHFARIAHAIDAARPPAARA